MYHFKNCGVSRRNEMNTIFWGGMHKFVTLVFMAFLCRISISQYWSPLVVQLHSFKSCYMNQSNDSMTVSRGNSACIPCILNLKKKKKLKDQTKGKNQLFVLSADVLACNTNVTNKRTLFFFTALTQKRRYEERVR